MLKQLLNQLDLSNKSLSEMGEIVSKRDYPVMSIPDKLKLNKKQKLKKSLSNNLVNRKLSV